ncbi:helix-turn-helix transcriptional regulator [Paenibacillus sp. OSY-SE]|uniref:helix-turn-helix transcriptional regulator n=1 Tax=Paenibacillus sp. OSY-SE TaxID=1196323 RepID=UPI00031D39E2|nr:LuxR C-terminal-related transcriptional regulator [Paenibacillus sp. OSY-SE]
MKLIATRLKPPAPRANYVMRSRLTYKLQQMAECKAVVVQGAAGSGKTTLVTSFLAEHPQQHVRWISLEPEHNDVYTFWYYMLEAMRADLGEEWEMLSERLEAMPQQHDLHNMLVIIVNRLQAVTDLTLILDDFHVIHEPDITDTLSFFMKHTPDSVRLILLTRTTPPLYFGEWMMSGKYMDIREEELRFTPEESADFLEHTLGVRLAPDIERRLIERAEGWVGGMQLMTLALHRKRNVPSAELPELNPYMLEYWSNEILNSLSEEEREFLIATSILGYFNESICRLVLHKSEARTLLSKLLDHHLFIITIDEQEGIYRYHHLFGTYLQTKFSEWEEPRQRELHMRAADIFEQWDDVEESIKHRLCIADYEGAMRLLKQWGANVRGWAYLRQIPVPALTDSFDLLFQRLFLHFCNMEFELCAQMMNQMRENGRSDMLDRLTFIYRFFLEDEAVEEGLTSASLMESFDLAEISEGTRTIIDITGAIMFMMRDQYAEALNGLERVLRSEVQTSNPYIRYFALILKGQLKELLGELKECEQVYASLFALLQSAPYLSAISMNSYIGVAGIYLKTMRLNEAEQMLNEARKQSERSYVSMERGYLINVIELHLLRGEKREASERLAELCAYDYYQQPSTIASLLKFQRLVGAVDTQLVDRFLSHMNERASEGSYMRYEDKLVYARLLADQERWEQALQLTDDVLERTRKHKVKVLLTEALLLKLELLDEAPAERNSQQARERERLYLMREAVHYSYANHYFYPFVLTAAFPHVRKLLDTLGNDLNAAERAFLLELISYMQPPREERKLLSDRELEVLQVMAGGASNKQIGEVLCISLATVKTHVLNIYGKLDVSKRIEAVEKARQLGLLIDEGHMDLIN